MQVFTHTMGSLTWTTRVPENPVDLLDFTDWIYDHAQRGTTIGVDTEGTGLDIFSQTHRLRMVQFGTPDEAWLIPVENHDALSNLAAWALRELDSVVLHNASFDALVFDRHLGVPVEDFMPRAWDTRILAHLFDSRKDYEGGTGHSLENLAAHYVDPGATDGQKDLQAEFRSIKHTSASGWAAIDLNNAVYQKYAAADVVLVSRLLPRLRELCREADVPDALIAYEHRVSRIGAVIERKGMRLDVEYTERLVRELKEEEEHFASVARRYGVTSVNAPKQVAEALVAMGEELTERTVSGQLAVGKEVLLPLADLTTSWERIGAREPNPLADAVLRCKRAGKWSTSYAKAMLDSRDGHDRVHPSINTLGARTGRWSVSSPPLQQLPSSGWRIRRCVVAERGHQIGASDLRQVELRVLAALAGADKIVERVNRGEDLHTLTTRLVHGIGEEVSDDEIKNDPRRKRTKTISLGKAYAGGPTALAKQTGLPVQQVKKALEQYDRALPEIKKFAARMERTARAQGMTIRTPSGRLLRLDRDKTYAAVAYLCQSSARDVLGQALCDIEDAGLLHYVVGVVHDEVLVEAPDDAVKDVVARVGECMRMPFFGCAIDSDPEVYGTSWADGYKLPESERYAA
jgi:DNA polymerase-1